MLKVLIVGVGFSCFSPTEEALFEEVITHQIQEKVCMEVGGYFEPLLNIDDEIHDDFIWTEVIVDMVEAERVLFYLEYDTG
jgi:hypothetical protein